ncbi:hypothetical protein K493DRAFT_408202 [Basidiobolus meristosporus CBS 931.73]|uniref:Sulfate transporter family protein n=1 Tax=Basidiobolus meristosporus CBS 931.73 TaxID=1314790 RepID=A0A1Y1Y7C0_9FUNG|nr:hypothetical protein K493DRAFT_408202 [Basidiobolus meristosporus CBS 931.73]|eukprot:ORX93910.1 hypothetical protein K493DRAFT_408202 [Basidiobolus meristosporus CBS 931.73]
MSDPVSPNKGSHISIPISPPKDLNTPSSSYTSAVSYGASFKRGGLPRPCFSSSGEGTAASPSRSFPASVIRSQSLALGNIALQEEEEDSTEGQIQSNLSLLLNSTSEENHDSHNKPDEEHRRSESSSMAPSRKSSFDSLRKRLSFSSAHASENTALLNNSTTQAYVGRSERSKGHLRMPNESLKDLLLKPVYCIPAVVLGLILNLLDGMSYGLISFPLSSPIFEKFGPDGLSMFLISTAICQVVMSTASGFRGGNGSMMIEVIPFLYLMCDIIIKDLGEDNPTAVIATVMVTYAISSMVTGIAFLLLGIFKLGSLVEFFPRHILVGCIGGVGYFLIQTAIEVCGQVQLHADWDTIVSLFEWHTLLLWSSSLLLALLLRAMERKIEHPMFVPCFFMVVPILFYAVVFFGGFDLEELRKSGWLFPLPDSSVPFYDFYTRFDFSQTSWYSIVKTIPAMLSLTFFGILHVPINVPALAVSTNEDSIDTNRELICHGVANFLSGAAGSFQNYLVYSNSILFIRSGGDSRLAGYMLAGATMIVFFMGPQIVGYIPVMVVGSLIYHLGFELMKEAVLDTLGIVHPLEYFTIWAIVVGMAALGFVEGIFLGILLGCIFFVVTYSTRNPIRHTYTGVTAKSTIRRLYRQRKFLDQVGAQIQVLKLQGFMFFGTINSVEASIRELLSKHQWEMNPIRFLILDFHLVNGIDFSAAEAFVRVRRLLKAKDIYMVISGVSYHSDLGKALRGVRIWGNDEEDDIQNFDHLNEALEWCENFLLQTYYKNKSHSVEPKKRNIDIIETQRQETSPALDNSLVSVRQMHLYEAANNALQGESHAYTNFPQPLALLLQAFQEISGSNEEFLFRLSSHFVQWEVGQGTVVWAQGDEPEALFLVEQGLLRMNVEKANATKVVESVLPGTMVGELGFFSLRPRGSTLVAERDSVLWKLSKAEFEKLCEEDPALTVKFMRLALAYSAEGLKTMTTHAFHLI